MNMYDQISEVAYLIYEKNGKVQGRDLDNWLESERIVLAQNDTQQEDAIAKAAVSKKRASRAGAARNTLRAEKSV